MLSNERTGLPHRGHALRGETTEMPAGTRYTTTFTNEPIRRPNTPVSTMAVRAKVARGLIVPSHPR